MLGIGTLLPSLIQEKIIHFIFYNRICRLLSTLLIGNREWGRICKVMGEGIWRTSEGRGFDTKPNAEHVSLVLMGYA